MFDFNFNNIAKLLIPVSLRQSKIIAWIKVLISQVKALKTIFMAYRLDALFYIRHNSQVIYIEHFLNSKFNPAGTANDMNYEGNGIYISDPATIPQVFVYNMFEAGTDVYLFNKTENGADTYLFNASEFPNRAGFIINVPDSFYINMKELSGWVDKLCLAGKKYTIKTYTI